MDIQKLYKGILESLNMTADEHGLLSFHYNGQIFPASVGDKRLALPTPELLRTGNWTGLVAFHPLSENLLRGESPVLKKLKAIVNLRLSNVIADLLQQLVAVGADTSKHARLNPKAQELLSHISDVDEKSVAAMERIISASSQDGPNRFISLYLKRGGSYKGTKYSRLGVVSFPILEEFENADYTVFGVKLRKKDFVAFKSLFLYILPDGDDLETYSAGTQSMVAPYFDVLLQAYAKVAERLNAVVWTQRKQLENESDLKIDLDWVEDAADLTVYRDMIPPLAGNDGEVVDSASEPAPLRPIPSVIASPNKLGAARPVVNDTPAETASPFRTDFANPVAAAPVAASHERVVVDQNHVKHTKNGIDFNSLMESRQRAVNHVPVGYVPPMPPAHMAPSWMQPAVAPVPVGSYAGYHRGVPNTPQYGYGHDPRMNANVNNANAPFWMNNGNVGNNAPNTNYGNYNSNGYSGGGYNTGGSI